jgi:hypothetical protein
MALVLYPIYLLKFWYVDATGYFLREFRMILFYCVQLFSLPLLTRTFFKPLKNEYRGDLVIFSIFFGMAVKSALIIASLLIMILLIVVFLALLIAFWGAPVILYHLINL